MRLGKVIGRVTLSQTIPAFEGARWLVVNPYTRDQFQSGEEPPEGMSPDLPGAPAGGDRGLGLLGSSR